MAFPIQQDERLSSVLRYVERNALRAGLVERAQDWRWGSLVEWPLGSADSFLHPGPVPRGRDWLEWVNRPQSEAKVAAMLGQRPLLRTLRQRPVDEADPPASRSGIHPQPRGRPRKEARKRGHSAFVASGRSDEAASRRSIGLVRRS
ncbi:MAG: hypothetical protein KY476_13100 [Planctomycetes bacterium]|nr:hypothetical protein [Planctomycetota bacterium]